jgi:hypothetical protein
MNQDFRFWSVLTLLIVVSVILEACSDKPRAVDPAKAAPLADAFSALNEIANESPGPAVVRVPSPSPSPVEKK